MSEDYEPQIGDKVRITIEGVYDPTCKSDGTNGYLSLPGANRSDIWIRRPDVEIERVRAAENWQPGDVVRSAYQDSKQVWMYLPCGNAPEWHSTAGPAGQGTSQSRRDDLPYRLVLIVRDGMPVPSMTLDEMTAS